MKKLIIILLLLGTMFPAYSQSKDPFAHETDTTSSRAIFGDDNRINAYTYNDYTQATAVAVWSSQFSGNYLTGKSLQQALMSTAKRIGKNPAYVATDVKFKDDPAFGFCTGFLIAPDILVTAGHCLDYSTYSKMEWIFDYTNSLNYSPGGKIYIGSDKRYKVKKILSHKHTGAGNTTDDYAVIQLDRPVNRSPFRFRTSNAPKYNDRVDLIGSPMGVPLKMVKDGYVSQTHAKVFHCNLDAFGGNSGGPVYNANGFIEGILVMGPIKGRMKGYHVDPTCNCIVEDKYDDVIDPMLLNGAIVYKMSNIPWKFKTKAIYENLEYAIKNKDDARFKAWVAYSWIQEEPTVADREPLAFVAARSKNLKALKQLVNAGFKVDTKGPKGSTLLDLAVEAADLETIRYLLKEGADPNHKKGGYKPVLYSALDSYNSEMVKLLINSGADVNYKYYYGDMPLHYAIKNSNETMVSLLLDNGADIKAKNGDGWSAKKVARKAKRKAMKKFIKQETKRRK
jgi:V8-like Glu-specific endopeptidase